MMGGVYVCVWVCVVVWGVCVCVFVFSLVFFPKMIKLVVKEGQVLFIVEGRSSFVHCGLKLALIYS